MTATLESLPGWATELVARARVARLGLLDTDDRPRVLPVTFALHEGSAWSAIDRKPKKATDELARVRYLRRRPEAALTVDHYEENWARLAWVQLLGRAAIVEAEEAPDALGVLVAKYGQYRSEPPPGPLIRIHPERVLSWRAGG